LRSHDGVDLVGNGKEYTGGRYQAQEAKYFPFKHDGTVEGTSGTLYTVVSEYPGALDADAMRLYDLDSVSAQHFQEDHALVLYLDQVQRGQQWIEIWRLFERWARRRYPDGRTLYALARGMSPEEIQQEQALLRALGYRLLSDNRRTKPFHSSSFYSPVRTWCT
jgi:hypothetical protein